MTSKVCFSSLRRCLLRWGLTFGLATTGTVLSQTPVQEPRVEHPNDFQISYTYQQNEIQVYGYRPQNYRKNELIVLMHGANRAGERYRDVGRQLADRFGAMLVVPEFDRKRFNENNYQFGGVLKDKQVRDSAEWTTSYIKPLVEEIRKMEGVPDLSYRIVGHSAGAQFVMRMAATGYPEDVTRMVAVNAGSLTFPTLEMEYPYGLAGLPVAMRNKAVLQRMIEAPLTLYIGSADIGMKDFAKTGPAEPQGATRYERSVNAYRSAKKVADENGWKLGWSLVVAEGLDHGSGPMWRHSNAPQALQLKEAK